MSIAIPTTSSSTSSSSSSNANVCSTCTFDNVVGNSVCSMCDTRLSSISSAPSSSSSTSAAVASNPNMWICRICTYSDNPLHRSRCSMCHTARNQDEEKRSESQSHATPSTSTSSSTSMMTSAESEFTDSSSSRERKRRKQQAESSTSANQMTDHADNHDDDDDDDDNDDTDNDMNNNVDMDLSIDQSSTSLQSYLQSTASSHHSHSHANRAPPLQLPYRSSSSSSSSSSLSYPAPYNRVPIDLSSSSKLRSTPSSTSSSSSFAQSFGSPLRSSSSQPPDAPSSSSQSFGVLNFSSSSSSTPISAARPSLAASFASSVFGHLKSISSKSPAPAAAAAASPAMSAASAAVVVAYTNEDSRSELTDAEAVKYFDQFIFAAQIHAKEVKRRSEGGKGSAISAAASSSSSSKKIDSDDMATLQSIVKDLYTALEYTSAPSSSSSSSSSSSTPARPDSCTVCFADFDDECHAVVIDNCGHGHLCSDCFQQFVSTKVNDESVTPWLHCPTHECRRPLTHDDIAHAKLDVNQLAHMITVYMRKRLVRCESFVSCDTKGCTSGWVVKKHRNGKIPKAAKMTCSICSVEQTVERGKQGELDVFFTDMIKAGTLRPCPKCKHLTMKEKGVCNVLQCLKCSVWWNWRTAETGKDQATLKYKARVTGSLWEAGELAYQQHLQMRNPAEFRALLERNGQEYDPNYVRGQG